jgi:hypothetical protein
MRSNAIDHAGATGTISAWNTFDFGKIRRKNDAF